MRKPNQMIDLALKLMPETGRYVQGLPEDEARELCVLLLASARASCELMGVGSPNPADHARILREHLGISGLSTTNH